MSAASLKATQAELKQKLRKYKKRQEEVNAIYNSLSSICSDGATDINKKMSNAKENLSSAIKPNSMISNAVSELENKRDKGNEDGHVDQVRNSLDLEKRRIQDEIDTLERQISKYDTWIAEAEEDERNSN